MNRLPVAALIILLALMGTARAQTPENCVLNPDRFSALDINHDGKLSIQEFKACAAGKASAPSLDDQFATIDRDHDGTITKAEAEMFMAETPLDATSPPAATPSADQPAAKPGQGQPIATDAAKSAAADRPVPPSNGARKPPASVAEPQVGQQVPAGQPQGSANTDRQAGPATGSAGQAPADAGPQSAQTAQQRPPANDGGSAGQARESAATPPAPDPHQLQAMAGTEAVTMDGRKAGAMSKVVAGPNNTYAAVIETGGFLGMGTTQRLVPLDQILMQNKQIVVNMSSEQLGELPKLDPRQWKDLGK